MSAARALALSSMSAAAVLTLPRAVALETRARGNAVVEVRHFGLGDSDLSGDRCGVAINGLTRGGHVVEVRVRQEAERPDRGEHHHHRHD
jgi:hypothetical protein